MNITTAMLRGHKVTQCTLLSRIQYRVAFFFMQYLLLSSHLPLSRSLSPCVLVSMRHYKIMTGHT